MRTRLRANFILACLLALPATAQPDAVDSKRVELGIALAKQGNLDDALRQFTLVLSHDPQNAAALNDAGNVHALRQRTERALELYQRALDADPEDGGIHLNLSLLHHELDQAQASARHMREGLRLVGDVEHAYYMLGLSHSAGGAISRASEVERLSDREIEALLNEAVAALPQTPPPAEREAGEAEEPKPAAEDRVQSRRTSTRAGLGERSPDRFYWKSTSGTK